MHRLGFGLVLLGMAAAIHAAVPENGVVVPSLDLMTVQSEPYDSRGLARTSRYRFTASIVPVAPIRPAESALFGLEFSNTPRLTSAADGPKETAWATNSNLTRFLGGDRAFLSPRLRIESAGERLEVIPRRHSVWIQWRKTLR